MKTALGFSVLITSCPPEYERLTAEIYYDSKYVARINEERGPGIFELETPDPAETVIEQLVIHKVELNGFLQTVELACQKLKGK